MPSDVKKVVVITGASSGIGKAAAQTLGQKGHSLVITARNKEALDEMAGELKGRGGEVLAVPSDITRSETVEAVVQAALERFGRIDVYVACAGQYIQGTVMDTGIDAFRNSMEVNFFGALYGIKAVLPVMKKAGGGNIVLVNSLDAKKGIRGDGPYVAAKTALAGLADVLRQEVRRYGIGVTSVFPGRVDTPMIEHIEAPWISPKIPAEAVVRAIEKAIETGRPEIVVPRHLGMLGAANDLFPRFMDWGYRVFRIEGVNRDLS